MLINERDYVYICLDICTLEPDDNKPSVKIWIATNNAMLTPIFEDIIGGQIIHDYNKDKGTQSK